MSFDLSFSNEFFTGTEQIEDIEVIEKPTNVLQSIISLHANDIDFFWEMVQDVFNIEKMDYLPESLIIDILDKIRETNTCTDLSSPISVWIDSEGIYTLEVYDD